MCLSLDEVGQGRGQDFRALILSVAWMPTERVSEKPADTDGKLGACGI
jgi:hypothetical protein